MNQWCAVNTGATMCCNRVAERLYSWQHARNASVQKSARNSNAWADDSPTSEQPSERIPDAGQGSMTLAV